jgi:hypothetical protein
MMQATEQFHAVYSLREQGYVCLFVCGGCGRRGNTVEKHVATMTAPVPRTPLPEGWTLGLNPLGGNMPLCDTCDAKRSYATGNAPATSA